VGNRKLVIDLFAGAGGFGLGAHLAGFSVAVAVDKDADLASSHALNFPETPLLLEDISGLKPADLLAFAGRERQAIDGIIGGPPCQGFSVIGARNPNDPRNFMLSHFFRFVLEIEPTFFLLENVPGLLYESNAPLLKRLVKRASKQYVVSEPVVVDASEFGAATRRRRVLIFGVHREAGLETPLAELLKSRRRTGATVSDAFEGLPALGTASVGDDGDWYAKVDAALRREVGQYARRASAAPPSGLCTREVRNQFADGYVSGFQPTVHTSATLARFKKVRAGEVDEVSRFPRLTWHTPAPTLRAGTGHDHGRFQAARPIHPTEHRVITVREGARLQGFPDWFTFHPTRWHSFRMIGNSVSPYVSSAVLKQVHRALYCDTTSPYNG
jgi:DNA (cytosine-5)-methyltransferase 1